jgi:serine-type D-Ala-D-Ala carboxypeptidase/endopeptidase (penicillin-binding protein 4)
MRAGLAKPFAAPIAALLLGWLSVLGGCANMATSTPTNRATPSPLPGPVQNALSQHEIPASALGFTAFPLDAPNTGWRWQAEQSMLPGSTMKVVTAIVALDKLGPNWRGRTELLAAGELQDGVLHGPLVLRGGFDAALDWGALASLLREARESGIQGVQGGVLLDRSRAQPGREDVGVAPFDEAPEWPYNAIPDALNLNGNLISLVLKSDRSGLQAHLSPAWPGLLVDASGMSLVDKPCAEWGEVWAKPEVQSAADHVTVKLVGAFPRACAQRQAFSLVDRDALAGLAVKQLWAELGGSVQGEVRSGPAPAGSRVVATHAAPPLAEWLRGTLKWSDNPLTRLLFLALGAEHPQAASFSSTRAAADAQVRDWLKTHGLPATSLVTDNGSGLSRAERLSPALLGGMLQAAADAPFAPELISGLPLAGVDGTMARRLKGTAAQAKARLKTGTLRDTAGVAGYVTDRSNRRWVVVALVNHPQAPAKGRPVLDALMAYIASLP